MNIESNTVEITDQSSGMDAKPHVMPLINFKSDLEFEKYIIDYCKKKYGIECNIFTISETFWHISGVDFKNQNNVIAFLSNYYFLKNPKYFGGRYTIQFYIDFDKSKLTKQYIDYHLCNKA